MKIIMMALALLFSGSSPTSPLVPLENAPIVHVAPTLLNGMSMIGSVVGDSLRIVVIWGHPTDGLGNEDSTRFRIKATKVLRFMGGGTQAASVPRVRRLLTATTADTFKLLKPAIGDSVTFTADSIQQFRQNVGSVPGTASWGYLRSPAPPSMTFIKVTTDSF